MAAVTYDAVNRELRNVVSSFAVRLPDSVRWTVEVDAQIDPGAIVGYWHWGDGTETAIVAPEGCRGFLVEASDRVSYQELGNPPAQLLLTLRALV